MGYGINPAELATIEAYVDDLETRLSADRADYLDELAAANLPADVDTLLTRVTAAVALASGVVVDSRTTAYGRLPGVNQVASTTIDLQQAAASYDLFTGTTQDVILEKLVIRLPNVDVSDDATITSISIQTDDVTPQVIISATNGAKANLTAEAQLGYAGVVLVKVGTKIRLTIAGGAADDPTVCDVMAEYRAQVGGGYLA